ncbi:hypothetical protein GCM10029978_111560 [Actinoallomurus acanthiterrae]
MRTLISTLAMAAIASGTAMAPVSATAVTRPEAPHATLAKVGSSGAATWDPRVRRRLAARPAVRTPRPAASNVAVDLTMLDRTGEKPATDYDDLTFFTEMTTGESYYLPYHAGTLHTELPPGRYDVRAFILTPTASGEPSVTLAVRPDVTIKDATSLTLDARTARHPSMTADRAGARQLKASGVIVLAAKVAGQLTVLNGLTMANGYVTPTGASPGLAVYGDADLAQDGDVTKSPYLYHAAGAFHDRIPADLTFHVRTADQAEVATRYAGLGGPGCVSTQTGAVWMDGTVVSTPTDDRPLPDRRVEYFTPGFDWWHDTNAGACDSDTRQTQMVTERFDHAGRYERARDVAPFGPALGIYNQRVGDELRVLDLGMYMESSANVPAGLDIPGASVNLALTHDGQVLATGNDPTNFTATVPPGRATYRLTADAQRDIPWTDLSTRQHVTWDFTSEHTDSATLPLLAVRYRTALDEQNRAPAGKDQHVEVRVERPGGAVATDVKKLTLDASFDDGATWRPVTLTRAGDHWTATLRNAADAHYVSLRARAADAAGDAVDQTLIHAYGLTR